MVTPTPNAIDSPAEPAVCTILFSRIVASLIPNFESRRKVVIEITATGIEALTVSPTFKTRYREDAPNTMPSRVPMIIGNTVNSRSLVPAGMYGRKLARKGFSGLSPIMSGNSLAPMRSLDISSDLRTSFRKRGSVRVRRWYFTRRCHARARKVIWRVVGHLKFFLFDGNVRSTKSHEASQNTSLLRAVGVTSWIVLFISTKEVGALIETDRLLKIFSAMSTLALIRISRFGRRAKSATGSRPEWSASDRQ